MKKKNVRTVIRSQILNSFTVMIQIRNQLKVQCSGLISTLYRNRYPKLFNRDGILIQKSLG